MSMLNVWVIQNRWWLIVLTVVAVVVVLYANVTSSPPGYYIDESSISYNAHLIAQTGRDEYGRTWPLYFRAFGDYKNPIYIYLLAALFKLTGPSILVARLLSAALGVAAALLLGLLGKRITGRRLVGLLVMLTALFTPWLFEMSRVVFEVALYPLALTLFLLSLQRASEKSNWLWVDIAGLTSTLAFLTYSYSIGRLLGPLLAFGLVIFVSRTRWKSILQTWVAYVITLVPLFLFSRNNPGALSERFHIITYVTPDRSTREIVVQFVKHYLVNLNPWKLLVTGDPNPNQVTHLYGTSLLLTATAIVVLLGTYIILRNKRKDTWWRYVLFATAISAVPASLTTDYVHMLRLAPLPVFLMVLTIPTFEWMLASTTRRRVLVVLVALTLIQGLYFQSQFRSDHSIHRRNLFDADYPAKIFDPAIASTNQPIYLADALSIPGYIQAYWYGVLRGVPATRFVRLPPNISAAKDALVITTEERCLRCRIVATSDFYKLYIAGDPAAEHKPLPPEAFRATIRLLSGPTVLRARQAADYRVVVKNEGNSVWLARERTGGPHQVNLGNHWLDTEAHMVVADDGRSSILADLEPGKEAEMSLHVNAPGKTGEYLLELDMVQEGVSWFGLKGSPTIKLRVRVE